MAALSSCVILDCGVAFGVRAAVSAVANGLSGEIVVNGETYNGVMPKLGLSDEEIANVVTFVANSWGNQGKEITPIDVQKVRSDH